MPDPRRLLPALVLAGALAGAAPLLARVEPGAMNPAKAALQRGDGIAGEVALRKVLAAGATRADVAARMGEALILQGDLVKARDWLGPGQFAPGEEGHGWRMLGMLERLDGNLPAAGQAYDKALGFAPKDPLLWVDIGRLRYVGGQQVQALDAAQRALAAAPDNPRALEFRAQLLRDQRGWDAALPLYEQALEQAPNDLSLLGGYAATLGEAGRGAEMLAVTRKMIGIAPKHPLAWYLQAVLAARAGKVDLARRLLERTGTRLQDVPAGLLLRGVLELEAGNANVAAGLLERLYERQGANQRLQLLYARTLYESNDFNKLHERFDPLASRPDAPAYLLELIGRAYEEQGDRLAAAPFLDRAAAATTPAIVPIPEPDPIGVLAVRWTDAPGVPATAVPYARSLLAAGNIAGAQGVAARFRELHPGSAEALALYGDVAMAAGQAGAAIDAYQLAAAVRFPDALLLRLGEAFDKAGRGADAVPVAARYLAAFPGSRMAARMVAGHRAFADDWGAARTLLENLRRRGGGRDVRLLADLSLAQLRTGDTAAALATAQQAHALQPASGVAAQALGMALAFAGQDAPRAAALLDKAQVLNGANPLLAEARRKLNG